MFLGGGQSKLLHGIPLYALEGGGHGTRGEGGHGLCAVGVGYAELRFGATDEVGAVRTG